MAHSPTHMSNKKNTFITTNTFKISRYNGNIWGQAVQIPVKTIAVNIRMPEFKPDVAPNSDDGDPRIQQY